MTRTVKLQFGQRIPWHNITNILDNAAGNTFWHFERIDGYESRSGHDHGPGWGEAVYAGIFFRKAIVGYSHNRPVSSVEVTLTTEESRLDRILKRRPTSERFLENIHHSALDTLVARPFQTAESFEEMFGEDDIDVQYSLAYSIFDNACWETRNRWMDAYDFFVSNLEFDRGVKHIHRTGPTYNEIDKLHTWNKDSGDNIVDHAIALVRCAHQHGDPNKAREEAYNMYINQMTQGEGSQAETFEHYLRSFYFYETSRGRRLYKFTRISARAEPDKWNGDEDPASVKPNELDRMLQTFNMLYFMVKMMKKKEYITT